MKDKLKIFMVATLIIILTCIAFLVIKILSVYNEAKHVNVSSQPIIQAETIEESVENNMDTEQIEEVIETYVSPYNGNYGKSFNSIFISLINSDKNSLYKDLLTLSKNFGYQLTFSGADSYTISSKSDKDSYIKISIDEETDKVLSSKLVYKDLLSLEYSPGNTSGEYIFENMEQGGRKYFSLDVEAVDYLLNYTNTHRYDPYASIEDDYGYSNWAETVTADTDTTTFTGYEPIEDIVVPNYFDGNQYMALNPDVVGVLGTDERTLYRHYIMHGRPEGRLYSLEQNAIVIEDLVYVTSVGSYYHRINCKYVEGDRNKKSLDIAKNFGYKACPECNP